MCSQVWFNMAKIYPMTIIQLHPVGLEHYFPTEVFLSL